MERGPVPIPRNASSPCTKHFKTAALEFQEVELQKWELPYAVTIRPGDGVELNYRNNDGNSLQSGDFLYIRSIIQDLSTDGVRLRGWKMSRESRDGDLFRGK
jgi:hypothetical protein